MKFLGGVCIPVQDGRGKFVIDAERDKQRDTDVGMSRSKMTGKGFILIFLHYSSY